MKITTSQKNLKQGLSFVDKVISKNSSLPILGNILLKTENGRLKLSATNLEIGINYFMGVKIEEPGEIAVPARIFSDFIGSISEDKLTLITKGNTLNINYDKYKAQILAYNPKDFPIIPKIKSLPILSIPAKVLYNSIFSVIDSVSLSETRPELTGILVQFSDNKASFASTDSFRLSEKNVELKSKANLSFILPRPTATELLRVSGDVDGDIQIKYENNQIAFSNEDIEIVSRVIDGNYPDYKKVIPEKWISKVLIKKEDLDKKTRLAGLFSSNISDIKMHSDDKNVTLLARNSDKGEIMVSVDCVLKNEPFDISLNYHYLLDGLKIISTEYVIIEYTGPGSPLIIRPEGDTKSLTYLIMPLRN